MNKFDQVVKNGKRARLSIIACQIEALLRQAGDLVEEIGDKGTGYLFISTLDKDMHTSFMIGNTVDLALSLIEAGAKNPGFNEVLTASATSLYKMGIIRIDSAEPVA